MALSLETLSDVAGARPMADVLNHRDPQRRIDLDATLPPTPVRDLLAASGATLFVLATDPGLLATVRRAADQHPLYVVDTWAELIDAVESGRCGIALLDAAVLGPRVAECVGELAAYADRLVTLVAADRATAQEFVGFLSNGRVHRLLIKPPAVGATRLLIESATARRFQLRDDAANDAPNDASVAPSTAAKWGWAVAVAASVFALLGGAIVGSRLGWWEGIGAVGTLVPPAATVAAPAAAPTPAAQLADYRARAALAVQEGRLVEPARDNALDHYLAILALVPTDQDARSGVASVVGTLFTRAEEALLAGSLDTAAAALDHVRRVDPTSSRLAFLDTQLARGLAAVAVPAAAPASAASPPETSAPTELDSVLSLATARLRRGQLLAPAGDSARAYLDRATELDAADPRVATLRAELATALMAAARLVSDADVAAAATLAAEARRLGAESADLVALERDVGAARARAEQRQFAERLGIARGRVQDGALFAPATGSALDHLSRLQAEAPELVGLAETWDTFRQAAVVAVQGTIESGDWATAGAQLVALAQAPGGAAVAAPLQAELAARRLQEIYLASAAPASELGLLSSVPVAYPAEAVERGVDGWVDLEFVVDRNGQPRELAVVQALPPGRFDAAALAAVAQYRYVPFERDGRVYERRLRLRVRFEIQ